MMESRFKCYEKMFLNADTKLILNTNEFVFFWNVDEKLFSIFDEKLFSNSEESCFQMLTKNWFLIDDNIIFRS